MKTSTKTRIANKIKFRRRNPINKIDKNKSTYVTILRKIVIISYFMGKF